MIKFKQIISNMLQHRTKAFIIELIAAIILLGGLIYYLIQSNIDACFNVFYFLFVLLSIIAVVIHLFIRFEFLTVITAAMSGGACGFIVYDMLPTLSDVWNGVNFIGGNLEAYIAYTAITLIASIMLIVASFLGTEMKKKYTIYAMDGPNGIE